MSYATPADLRQRYQEPLLAQLTDPLGVAVEDAVLQEALDDAAALINSYLPAQFTLPLPAGSAHVLKLKACDIAVYNLMSLRAAGDLEDHRKRYEDALRFLRDVADGRISLGTADGASPAPVSAPRLTSRRARVFGPEQLEGFL